ncbi:MAG TPA: helix-turn-helix domain-containing protein [Acidobacteriaceae bacterium]|jgi:HTH-type transcriptional regulator/antitoxin HigA|nr:helix-turn-helix domain-containing protein [Acidobacteriaceae bacterium]
MKRLGDPVEMVERGAPRVIRNDSELKEYTDALFRLTVKSRITRAEQDAIDLLSLLIERYESERFQLPSASPLDVLRFLMGQHGTTQRDLKPELGSESLVSLILAGRRNLTVSHMYALAKRFNVPASVFLGSADRKAA